MEVFPEVKSKGSVIKGFGNRLKKINFLFFEKEIHVLGSVHIFVDTKGSV